MAIAKVDLDARKEKLRQEVIERQHPVDSHEDDIPKMPSSIRIVPTKSVLPEKEADPNEPKKGLIDRIKEEFEWKSMVKSARKWSKEVLFGAVADTAIEMIDQIGGDFRTRLLASLGLKAFDKNLRKRSRERDVDRRFGNASYKHYSRMSRDKSYDFDDILFEDRRDAELVLDVMLEKISATGEITVYDFLKMDQVDEVPERNDKNYGWENLRKASVCYNRKEDAYYIDLPDPIDLR